MHVGTEWGHIVQEFHNFLLPGESVDVPAASFFGWQDVVVKHGLQENKISHKDDWKSVMGIAVFSVGGVAEVVGAGLAIIVTGGVAAPAVLAAVSAQTLAVSAAAATTAGIVTLAAETAVTIADFTVRPAVLNGMWGPDGYEIDITGGDVTGFYDETSKKFVTTEVRPISLSWKNTTSGTSGKIGDGR